MENSEKIASKLNDLLEKNYDSEKGYKVAEENVKDSQLKDIFRSRSQNRYDFGHELKAEIKKLGESPDKGTSVKGDLHRAWMNIKSSLASNTDEAILEEAIRGEKAAVADYDSVIAEEGIPSSTKDMLVKQRDQIKNALEQVKNLERKKS
jgi:uncharacterized protein (TIGR02284 family)